MKTIKTVAQEMLDNLETRKRDNGDSFICTIETIEWQQDIIRGAHLDRMPSDDIYNRIYEILDVLSGIDDDADEDTARDEIYTIGADDYTSDLMKWLSDHGQNLYYADEILKEGNTLDFFNLLQMAQLRYIEEIANELLSGIVKYIEDGE